MQVQRPLFCFETSKTGQCSCTDTPTTRPGLACSDATPASDVVFAFPSRMCSWLPVAVTRARLQMTRAAAATNPTASSRTSPATGKTAKKFKSSSRFRTSQCNVRWVAACLFRTSREGCICQAHSASSQLRPPDGCRDVTYYAQVSSWLTCRPVTWLFGGWGESGKITSPLAREKHLEVGDLLKDLQPYPVSAFPFQHLNKATSA